jgi:hypothetical protein
LTSLERAQWLEPGGRSLLQQEDCSLLQQEDYSLQQQEDCSLQQQTERSLLQQVERGGNAGRLRAAWQTPAAGCQSIDCDAMRNSDELQFGSNPCSVLL